MRGSCRRRRSSTIVWLALLGMVVSGCASVVDKQAAEKVKRAAIVSLYANEKVPHEGGGGVVRDWDDTVRLQVAEDALTTFTGEMRRMGWEMVSPEAVIQSPEYREIFAVPGVKKGSDLDKVVGFLQQSYQRQFFAPAGMLPIQLDDREINTRYLGDAKRGDPKHELGQMAKRLGVDAVVVVQIDYCYDGGTFSLLGTGEAVMTAASSVKMINQDGEMVINMPQLAVCGGDERARSDSSAAMIRGDLMFTRIGKARFRNMFIEATRKSAETTISELLDEMS